MSWTTTALLLGFFAGIGAAIDRFTLARHKTLLHQTLIRFWVNIDDWDVRDYPKYLAASVLSINEYWRTWAFVSKSLSVFSVSWVLTSSAYLLGTYLDGTVGFYSIVPLPIFTYYAVNMVFDLATVYVTLRVLLVIKNSSTLAGFMALLVDAVLAVTLAAGCYTGMATVENYHGYLAWIPGVSGQVEAATARYRKAMRSQLAEDGFSQGANIEIREQAEVFKLFISAFEIFVKVPRDGVSYLPPDTVKFFVSEDDRQVVYEVPIKTSYVTWYGFLVSATTLIPTLILVLILIVMILSKLVTIASKSVALYFLELATQPDPASQPKEFMPFTLLGILFGVIAGLLKLIGNINGSS